MSGITNIGTYTIMANATSINGDSGNATGASITLTGGTSGAQFAASGSTVTESFQYLALPNNDGTNTQGFISMDGDIIFKSGSGAGADTGIYIGKTAGGVDNTGPGNTVLGASALTTGASGSSYYNTAIGYAAGNSLDCSNNVAIGYLSLVSAVGGEFVGWNTAVGKGSLQVATSANGSTCLGAESGFNTVTSSNDVMIGYGSGRYNGTSDNNVLIGAASGYQSPDSSYSNCVFIGSGAGNSSTTAITSSSILINNDGASLGGDHTLAIGAGTGTGTQQLHKAFISGIRGITTGQNNAIAVLIDSQGQLGTVSSTVRAKENIFDLGDISNSILSLRPVIFNYIGKPADQKQVGLIAEEVEKVMPLLVAYDRYNEPISVKYHDLPILLLNELQKALKRIEVLEQKLGI